jgi:hypothetical protein
MRRKILAALCAAGVMLGASAAASGAAPITCPGNQEPVKTADGWDCQNNGGNTSNAENPKNPNVGKGFF